MKKKKYYLKLTAVLLLMCVGIMFALILPAEANSVEPVSNKVLPQELINNYQSISHYYIDMVTPDFLNPAPGMLNYVANYIFYLEKSYVFITSAIFYYTLDFDLASYFESEINSIQAAMRSSIFEPLFFIGVAGSAIIIIKRMLKRDLMGMYGQLLKIIVIFVLSLMIVTDSGAVIANTTRLTSSIGVQILTGANGDDASVSNYTAKTIEKIWSNMVHVPWEYIEFGNDPYEEKDVDSILMKEPFNPQRLEIIENWEHGEAFQTSRAVEKVGFTSLYMIPLIIKCTIYIVMGGILLLFQLMAVFYVLLAPLILILAMFPAYEHIISTWVRKFIEIQISALVLYFVIGLLFKVDDILFQSVAVEWGWLVVLMVQVVLYVGVILKRNDILGVIGKMGVATPRTPLNNGVHSAKAAVIKSIAAARMFGGKKDSAVQKGVTAANVTQKSNPKGKTVERPVIKKQAASGADTTVSQVHLKIQAQPPTNSGRNQLEAYTERFRSTQVERKGAFIERPTRATEGPARGYADKPVLQRPRMDEIILSNSEYREIKPT